LNRRLVVALLALASLAPRAAAAGPPEPATLAPLAARPRLVLFVVVDQMRFDYLTRFDALYRQGLRRLLDEGAVFENARFAHANTETGPGHAVLASGLHASRSGIIANEWWDWRARAMVNVVDDPVHASVGGGTRAASPANLNAFTIGDALKKASPASRVVSASFKDRAAVLLGGRRADAAFWFDDAAGRFVTSTYYAREMPRWLAAWQRKRPADRYHARAWTRLLADPAVYERLAGPDAQPGEGDAEGITFPHALKGAPPEQGFYASLRRTPFADELLLDLALRVLDEYALGRRAATDILFVGFSAHDGIGHTYGPGSQEAMDSMLRLDRALGRLLEAADRATGGRTLVVLSADHGVMPLVEVARQKGIEARRAPPAVIEDAARKALEARFPGAAGLVSRFDPPHFYLDLDALDRQGLRRREVEAVIVDAALSTGIVKRAYTAEDLLGQAPPDDALFPLVAASFFEPRSPHVVVQLEPFVYLSTRSSGTGHGSPQDYDRHVPIVFMGPGVKAGRHAAPCAPGDVAPTLGALLGIDFPLDRGRRLLAEVAPRSSP
jgi:predicted AlkP superfamily pyrophosphatase or phosphodiesterase